MIQEFGRVALQSLMIQSTKMHCAREGVKGRISMIIVC